MYSKTIIIVLLWFLFHLLDTNVVVVIKFARSSWYNVIYSNKIIVSWRKKYLIEWIATDPKTTSLSKQLKKHNFFDYKHPKIIPQYRLRRLDIFNCLVRLRVYVFYIRVLVYLINNNNSFPKYCVHYRSSVKTPFLGRLFNRRTVFLVAFLFCFIIEVLDIFPLLYRSRTYIEIQASF